MGISIVCAVMDRAPMLSLSLVSWLRCKEVERFIIVDWSSRDLSDDLVAYLCSLDGRVSFVRVAGKELFHMSGAFNFGVAHVRSEFVLKLDVDHVFNPYYNFFDVHKLGAGEFITGDWQCFTLDNDFGFLKCLNGLLFAKVSDFRAVGGYNVELVGYGYEDHDLYHRLKASGLTHRFLDVRKFTVYHNPHGNEERVVNFVEKDISRSILSNVKVAKGSGPV
jgi:predicted glycosyltransferase involved in capsule biosynthesis